MLYVLGNDAKVKAVTNRLPSAEHWNVYRHAQRDFPGLITAMYETVEDVVNRGEYMEKDGRFPNSTWVGSEILKAWDRGEEWDAAFGDREISNALFGQIMWTVMFDHDQKWCTTVTPNANADREERVYWLLTDK